MVEALTNDALIDEAPAIVGCQTPPPRPSICVQLFDEAYQCCRVVAFAIALEKNLPANHSLAVNQNRARVWEAFFVMDSIGFDDFAVGVGKQKVGDLG